MSLSDWYVLIVEDEPDSMELVEGILDYYGIRHLSAVTGEEALHLLQTEQPTLIIVDLALPGINGWSLLEAIKHVPALRQVPRVAITAYHNVEVANKAIEYGFDAYFAKPLDTMSFVRELELIVSEGRLDG